MAQLLNMSNPRTDPLLQVETTCGSLLYELKIIWDEVGESVADKDRMLLELEKECLEVYRRKVDLANRSRAQLRQAIADAEAELAAICSATGERPVHIRQSVQNTGSLKEELGRILPQLEEMRKRKSERRNQFLEVQEQIQKISNEIYGSTEYISSMLVVDESDLSMRKLEELHRELHELQKEKSDRLRQVQEHVCALNSLCSVLGVDSKKILTEVHPSLRDFERSKNISNGTIEQLAAAIQKLRELAQRALYLSLTRNSQSACAVERMNRVIARKLAANVSRLKVRQEYFCTDAAAGVSGFNRGQSSQEQKEKNDFANNIQQYDIAIVGGGMVGMALACSLASMPLTKHLNVAIIDSNPALGSRVRLKKGDPPDARVSTVTPATISLFKDVGAWQYIEQNRHAYFHKMQVWDYTGLGYTRYNARDINKEVLGCVVENKVLHDSLLSCIEATDFQKTFHPSRLTSMTLHQSSSSMGMDSTLLKTTSSSLGHLAKLELSDGKSIFAKLVVGADGGKSRVRELAGFKTTGWNYSQNAVICTVEHSVENQCAWQRFLPAGPIALLPMGNNFSNIVWTMNPKEAGNRKLMNEDDFVKDTNAALDYGYGPHPKSSLLEMGDMFSWLRGDVTLSATEGFEVPPKVVKLASERMVFPLSLKHANDYASKRVVLIGDAAHTVHPLAGQGVNMGFGDALALSRVIAEGIAVGIDIGEVTMLKKYEEERKRTNIMMMAILDGFQKAYSVDFGPLNILRAAVFHGANYISPLKRNIISYASGDQRLPLFS